MAPSKKDDKVSGPTAFEARVAALHTYLLSTLTAHTLKDLEKTLPAAVSGISGITAKDHIQALVDESVLRVEKIGTGNWYWCFGSEARRERDRVKQQITAEVDVVRSRVDALRADIEKEQSLRTEDVGEDAIAERQKLTNEIEILKKDVAGLNKELAKYEDGDPTTLQTKRDETRRLRDMAEIWTDNCWTMEQWMKDSVGVTKQDSIDVLRDCYGNEFVEDDQGLSEIV